MPWSKDEAVHKYMVNAIEEVANQQHATQRLELALRIITAGSSTQGDEPLCSTWLGTVSQAALYPNDYKTTPSNVVPIKPEVSKVDVTLATYTLRVVTEARISSHPMPEGIPAAPPMIRTFSLKFDISLDDESWGSAVFTNDVERGGICDVEGPTFYLTTDRPNEDTPGPFLSVKTVADKVKEFIDTSRNPAVVTHKKRLLAQLAIAMNEDGTK